MTYVIDGGHRGFMVISTLSCVTASTSAFSNTTFLIATPIKHFVLLYQENNSFDHYFGTYPNATNPICHLVYIIHVRATLYLNDNFF